MSLRTDQLTKCYSGGVSKRKRAVNDLSLKISKGEVFGFLGPNGAGKSTVIKILMDFIRPSSGEVTIAGMPVDNADVRRKIGYLPENPFFYDHLTAKELLTFGAKAAGVSSKMTKSRIDRLLERLKLRHAMNQRIRTYSKGMLQRAGLGLALVHDPDICILDEPMSGLDPLGRKLVADVIRELHQKGKTVFFSSHILSDIESLCDRVGIINRGKLLYDGDLKQLLKRGKGSLESAFVSMIEEDGKATHG